MLANLVAVAEPNVDEVDTRRVNDGNCTGFRVCTRVPGVVTELHVQTNCSEAGLLEKGSGPLLQTR